MTQFMCSRTGPLHVDIFYCKHRYFQGFGIKVQFRADLHSQLLRYCSYMTILGKYSVPSNICYTGLAGVLTEELARWHHSHHLPGSPGHLPQPVPHVHPPGCQDRLSFFLLFFFSNIYIYTFRYYLLINRPVFIYDHLRPNRSYPRLSLLYSSPLSQ